MPATLPSGFQESSVPGGWSEPVGLTFDGNGRMFVWERAGRIWTVEGGVKSAVPFLDLRHEVGGWRDFGLLGFALHPNFLQNGHVYLLYVVDRHHLMNFGTPAYDTNRNDYFAATIGRITRYTARSGDGFRTVDPASRLVLVGESRTNGFPILHESHGVGHLVFGSDSTLLASCGDGASYSSTDIGNAPESYYSQALTDGIIRPKENVGAYRSQLVDSLSGKIIRIDPETGDGVPSNPFYDTANPRAPRSRVWSLGFRNPYRFALRPGSGSHDRDVGNPGALFIGDVGWYTWEELSVATGPGQNFGWPVFEGLTASPEYTNAAVANRDAPNPLYNTGGCTQQYFHFRDLIQQASLRPPFFPNPCNRSQPIPSNIRRFVHRRPALDWHHGAGPSRAGTFDANSNAIAVNIGAAGSPVSGPQFGGNASTAGTWYEGSNFPVEYRNTYFHADFGGQWIRSFTFNSSNAPVSVRNFAANTGGIVFLAGDPASGGLYYIDWTGQIWHITYQPSGNRPPVAVAAADRLYGPSPLTVNFTGSASSDPDGQALTYRWNFGDGTPTSSAANPSHTFNAAAGTPRRFNVTLTVTDSAGATNATNLVISANNTPPAVTITSPMDGAFYSVSSPTTLNLRASVTDAEHSAAQLSCAWQTILHHNNHMHSEPVDTNCVTSTQISPVGCDGDSYHYRITLTVTDAHGLATTREVRLYPNCPGGTNTLVPRGAAWKFLDNGSNPGSVWRGLTYNDNAWRSGAAELGYGDGDEATVVSYGANANAKHIATWFRHTFVVREPSLITNLQLNLLRDDGAIIYLNSNEVFRSNMPTGAVTYTTLAASGVSGAQETTWHSTVISAGLLRPGTNVLAAQVHQNTNNSTDLSFNLELLALTTPADLEPSLKIARSGTNVVLSWPQSAVGFRLQVASGIRSPWFNVTNAPAQAGGRSQTTLPIRSNQQFFRLRRP